MKNNAKLLGMAVCAAALVLAACGNAASPDTGDKTPAGMVSVAGGTFQMGSESGESDEQPVHPVTLSAFYMGKYEVTQARYEEVMGSNPSHFTSGVAAGETQENRPVEMVSWYDALVFCNTLSMSEGLTPAYSIGGSTNPADWGSVPDSPNSPATAWDAVECNWSSNGYRLPTEAEWEYAARGGNESPGNYEYSGSGNADAVAWYDENSEGKTHEAGKKAPNGLGLYDMSGNVCEWCWDWYATYPSAAQTNPRGAVRTGIRVTRGGNWNFPAKYTHSATRYYHFPSLGDNGFFGFRLVRPQL